MPADPTPSAEELATLTARVAWRWIPKRRGYYLISTDGDVISIRSNRRMKPSLNGSGYRILKLSRGGETTTIRVHRAVAEAFLGSAPGMVVRHLNGKHLDNRLANLAFGTIKENAADAILHGAQVNGERVNTAKLCASQVVEIKRRTACGENMSALGREFGVGQDAISDIASGKRWKHIPMPAPPQEKADG